MDTRIEMIVNQFGRDYVADNLDSLLSLMKDAGADKLSINIVQMCTLAVRPHFKTAILDEDDTVVSAAIIRIKEETGLGDAVMSVISDIRKNVIGKQLLNLVEDDELEEYYTVDETTYIPDEDLEDYACDNLEEVTSDEDSESLCGIGDDYYFGQGVEISYTKAVEYFRKAAEYGYAYAQYSLGYCYEHGQGVDQSYEEAVKWYRKAANQGNSYAQNSLGNCYYNGLGV